MRRRNFVVFSVWGVGAVLAFLGAQQRQRHRRKGDALIALGVVPALVAGIIAYWFPPMWLIAAAGLLVMWSATRDAVAPADIAKMAT